MSQLRTPLKTVRGLGSARGGTHHFVVQRITAVALVPLALWFVWIALSLIHLDYAGARALIAHPCNALLLAAFVLAVFWHARLGLQVVVEDYVHGAAEIALQVAIKLIYALAAIAALLAIGRIVFTA